MVYFEITKVIESALSQYFESESSSEYKLSHDQLDNYKSCISHADLIALAKSTGIRLSTLTKGLVVFIAPKPAAPPKTKEYIELMEKLRYEQAEQEYRTLVDPSFSNNTKLLNDDEDEELTPGQQIKQVREQLTTIFNILISVGSVAFAAYYATRHWNSMASRTLLCVFSGILVLVAEVTVYLGYKRKVKEAKVTEVSKREVKTVLKTYDLALEDDNSDQQTELEKAVLGSLELPNKETGLRRRKV